MEPVSDASHEQIRERNPVLPHGMKLIRLPEEKG
jgi:hypothetical protein